MKRIDVTFVMYYMLLMSVSNFKYDHYSLSSTKWLLVQTFREDVKSTYSVTMHTKILL